LLRCTKGFAPLPERAAFADKGCVAASPIRRFVSFARRPPWRTVLALLVVGSVGAVAWRLWSPGLDVRDGRHDLGRNAIWLQHGWLGDDRWFRDNDRQSRLAQFRDPARVEQLSALLREHHITDLFPHLCPTRADGSLPGVDAAPTERFLDGTKGLRVLPWVGGAVGVQAAPSKPKWRTQFAQSIRALLLAHPRLAGVHVNLEPWPSGDRDYLATLDEIRAALPEGRLLSVAAYPPPTLFQPFAEVHWERAYRDEVARRADQLVVMMYDTALGQRKRYVKLMADWTVEVLSSTARSSVVLGLPAYDDAGVGYHDPAVENLDSALEGIHAGLAELPSVPPSYQGVAVYCDWQMTPAKWRSLKERFERAGR
jgi:hypothetical protein